MCDNESLMINLCEINRFLSYYHHIAREFDTMMIIIVQLKCYASKMSDSMWHYLHISCVYCIDKAHVIVITGRKQFARKNSNVNSLNAAKLNYTFIYCIINNKQKIYFDKSYHIIINDY